MTDEHKRKISESCKGKSKNKGKIYINNGIECKSICPQDLEKYIKLGYCIGRYFKDYKPWNKGLKASNDPRVAKMRRLKKEK